MLFQHKNEQLKDGQITQLAWICVYSSGLAQTGSTFPFNTVQHCLVQNAKKFWPSSIRLIDVKRRETRAANNCQSSDNV